MYDGTMADEEFVEDASEEDVYSEEGREGLTDDAEITPEEEAFMQGYDEEDEPSENEGDEEESTPDDEKG